MAVVSQCGAPQVALLPLLVLRPQCWAHFVAVTAHGSLLRIYHGNL